MQPNIEHYAQYADKYYELATQGRQCYEIKYNIRDKNRSMWTCIQRCSKLHNSTSQEGTWDQSLGYLCRKGPGTSHQGTSPERYLGPVTGVPSRKGPGTSHWGVPQKGHGTNGCILGWRWGTPLPSVNRHTNWKYNLLSWALKNNLTTPPSINTTWSTNVPNQSPL